jgi:DNA-directed RNA polymerase specialized sigma24 family protein
VIYRSARTRRGAQVSAARRGKEAGPAAPADPDDARAERWPGVADFGDLVRRYRRELHVYCSRMPGSFDEAEDHVQEVFLRTWRARERFQGQSSPRTWLYRVATNACLDTLRRDARRGAERANPAGVMTRGDRHHLLAPGLNQQAQRPGYLSSQLSTSW